MIVLRITTGQTTQEVRTERTDVVLGSDPTADITLQDGGLPHRAVRIQRRQSELDVQILGSDRKVTLRVGDEIEVGGSAIELAGLLPQGDALPPPMFGGYEDDLQATAPKFELAEALPSPESTPTPPAPPPPQPVLPRADEPAPAATQRPAAQQRKAPAPPSSRPAPAQTSPRPRPAQTRKTSPSTTPAASAAAAAALAEAAKQEARKDLKPVEFPEPDFASELMAQLKRSPFFAVSLAVHLLIALILTLFDSTNREKPLPAGPGAINASMMAEEEELGEEFEEMSQDEGLPQPEAPMPDLDDLLEPEDKPPPPPKPAPPSPFKSEMQELEDPEVRPVEIGIMPGLTAASTRPRKRRPKVPKAELKRDFTKGAAGSSNQRAAEVVRAALGRGRYGKGAKLNQLEKEDVLVVDGSFDHIEKVLDMLQIQYVKKSTWFLATPKPEDFRGYKIVFWNCGERLGKRHMAGVAKKLREFVRNGGYLFTTDWAVAHILDVAFKGYLKTTGNRAHLPEMTLPIEASPSATGHPLLEGVFIPGVKGKWWLENASFDVHVGRKDKVTVLIESPMLESSFNRSPIVAATFNYGRGRVLHAMGHYYQEAGNLAGTISVHRLALNFILMRLDQDKGQ